MPLFYEPGRYVGRVTNHVLGRTKTGKPQFILTFEVIGKADGGDVPANYERSVFRVITDKTVDYVMQDLDQLGFSGEKFGDLDVAESGVWDIRGQEFAFSCTHEEYDGKHHERWSLARDGGTMQHTPLESKEVRQLDALFGRELKARKKQAAYSEPAKPEPPKKPIAEVVALPEEANAELAESSDDIPF